jgi:hypothetical protein
MLKSKTYNEYLEWWNYWNSKVPRPGSLVGRVAASTVEAKRDFKTYRERLQRQLIEIRNLQGERALGKEISLELTFNGGANKGGP